MMRRIELQPSFQEKRKSGSLSENGESTLIALQIEREWRLTTNGFASTGWVAKVLQELVCGILNTDNLLTWDKYRGINIERMYVKSV